MKALLFIITLVLSLASFADIGPINRSANLTNAGAVQSGTLEKIFINVKNSSGGTLSAGQIVVADLTDDDGVSVDITTTAGSVPMCMITESCAVGKLCKNCQTYGLYDSGLFAHDGVNAVAGKPFFISEALAGSIGAISSPGGDDIAAGVFLDDATATGAVQVFIKMR